MLLADLHGIFLLEQTEDPCTEENKGGLYHK